MFNFKIKWIIAFHSIDELEAQLTPENTAVIASTFGRVLWVKHKGQYHAFKNKCPHQNKPMNDCWINEGALICPFHRYHFSIENGRGMGTSMHKYEVKVENGKVWLGKEVFRLF